jgi:hypothetical protein
MATSRDWADLGERTLSTVFQAGLVESGIYLLGLDQVWLIPLIGAVTAVKAALARKFGNGTSAALPQSLERV